MSDDQYVVVRWHVKIGRHGDEGVWNIGRAVWDTMTDVEREAALDELMQAEIANTVDAGYSIDPEGGK